MEHFRATSGMAASRQAKQILNILIWQTLWYASKLLSPWYLLPISRCVSHLRNYSWVKQILWYMIYSIGVVQILNISKKQRLCSTVLKIRVNKIIWARFEDSSFYYLWMYTKNELYGYSVELRNELARRMPIPITTEKTLYRGHWLIFDFNEIWHPAWLEFPKLQSINLNSFAVINTYHCTYSEIPAPYLVEIWDVTSTSTRVPTMSTSTTSACKLYEK